jgi:Thioesterase-like superfamily
VDAFYDRREGLFHPTPATVGPWDPKLQHGGPPAALLASILDQRGAREGTRIAYFSLDFLGPVPLAPMRVDTEIRRPGKKIELSEAVVAIDGREALRARAWRVSVEADRNPEANLTSAVPPLPDVAASCFFPGVHDFGYAHALEWRFVDGGFETQGRATAWSQLRAEIVRGESPSALARVLAMVDSANGISAELDVRAYLFVPVNLTVSLTRNPRTDATWFGMRAVTSLAREGTGTTRAEIFDEQGQLGEALQTLYVEKRR